MYLITLKYSPLKFVGYCLPEIWFYNEFKSELDFSAATFYGVPSFDGVMFSGGADFFEAQFTCEAKVDFRGATFSGGAIFFRTRFSGEADFFKSTFSGEAIFIEAKFEKLALFRNVKFLGQSNFIETNFKVAKFREASFSKKKIYTLVYYL